MRQISRSTLLHHSRQSPTDMDDACRCMPTTAAFGYQRRSRTQKRSTLLVFPTLDPGPWRVNIRTCLWTRLQST
jgi:hypothetical protein